MVNLFAVPIFFVCFREAIETSIIVSVLLSFLKQTLGEDLDPATYKKLVGQIWWGTGLGIFLCLVVGAAFIGIFYSMGKDHWAGTENIWEAVFALVASLFISWMGAALLRVSKLQDKWRVKLAKARESKSSTRRGCWNRFKLWCEKYAMFTLTFITVVREGLEAVIFIGGISLSLPATAFPLPVFAGLLCGCLIGFFIYKGGNAASLQTFLIISTCFLYLVAAGLFSKAVWLFEVNHWNKVIGADASESGSGPGSYDIRKSVWHVNCCNPKLNGGGGWGIFNGILGWQNSATYGSVLSYDLYWLVVILGFLAMRYNEKKGHWPLMTSKATEEMNKVANNSRGTSIAYTDKEAEEGKVLPQVQTVER